MSIVVSGVMHRILRSTMTMCVILLAVAFFMVMLSESVFIRSIGTALLERLNEQKAPARKLNFMYSVPSSSTLRNNLASMTEDNERIAEYARVAGTSREDVEKLAAQCRRIREYVQFFGKLNVGQRLVLIGKRHGMEIFRYLADKRIWDDFLVALAPMHSIKLPAGENEFRGFLDGFASFEESFAAFEGKWRASIDRFSASSDVLMKGIDRNEWLRNSNKKDMEAFRTLALEHYFSLTISELSYIRQYLQNQHLKNNVIKSLNTSKARKAWNTAFARKHNIDEKLLLISDPRTINVLDKQFTAEELNNVKEIVADEKHLAKISDSLAGKAELESNRLLSNRQVFLLIISFVVCMVGITNAVLMAITERFREIATMKCLGATDGFILTQFLLEAGIQGLVGGILGMLVGLLLSFIKNLMIFGGFMLANISVGPVILSACVSLLAGIFLSMAASLYPSLVASRMAPMEAMRVE